MSVPKPFTEKVGQDSYADILLGMYLPFLFISSILNLTLESLTPKSNVNFIFLDFTSLKCMQDLVPKVDKKKNNDKGDGVPKFSSFLITVSSNQNDNTLADKQIDKEKFAKKLKKVVLCAVANKENYIPRGEGLLASNDIYDIKISSKEFEIGSEKGNFHVHATVTVRYKNMGSTYFHVDIPKLRAEILRPLPVSDIHLNVEYVKKTPLHRAINYVNKTNALGEDSGAVETGEGKKKTSETKGGSTKKRRGVNAAGKRIKRRKTKGNSEDSETTEERE